MTIESVMRKIAAGTLTRKQAAVELDLSERQVNRLMLARGVARPASAAQLARKLASEEAASRRELLREAVKNYLAGRISLKLAAEHAERSERTIYRQAQRERVKKKGKARV